MPAFKVAEEIDAGLKPRLERFLRQAGIEIAGIEFAIGAEGRPQVYDVSAFSNYNAEAAARVPSLRAPTAMASVQTAIRRSS